MSNENQAEKLDVLFGKVYLPVFMQKLAAAGVKVANEEDLQETLKVAAMLRTHVAQTEAKPVVSAIKAASASLEKLTYGPKSIVDSFATDPEVIAALS